MLPIIVIVGPTGVGKTKLSVELAKRMNAEIINADSMQVYKGLNIGTAKIKEEEKKGIAHHLFDIVDVKTLYTVYDYQKDCRKKIKEITSRGKRVILVGGTGLYIKAALFDYRFQEGTNQNSFDSFSNEELLEKVKTYEPQCEIHINNRRRLVRTLNKYESGEKKQTKGMTPVYPFIIVGLTTDRKLLYEKINERVDQMMNDDLLQEVKYFYDQGIRSKAVATGIGYKELYAYLDHQQSLEDAIEQIKKNSRHYAKRQYTFFRHQMSVTWFYVNYENFSKTIEEVWNYLMTREKESCDSYLKKTE